MVLHRCIDLVEQTEDKSTIVAFTHARVSKRCCSCTAATAAAAVAAAVLVYYGCAIAFEIARKCVLVDRSAPCAASNSLHLFLYFVLVPFSHRR